MFDRKYPYGELPLAGWRRRSHFNKGHNGKGRLGRSTFLSQRVHSTSIAQLPSVICDLGRREVDRMVFSAVRKATDKEEECSPQRHLKTRNGAVSSPLPARSNRLRVSSRLRLKCCFPAAACSSESRFHVITNKTREMVPTLCHSAKGTCGKGSGGENTCARNEQSKGNQRQSIDCVRWQGAVSAVWRGVGSPKGAKFSPGIVLKTFIRRHSPAAECDSQLAVQVLV